MKKTVLILAILVCFISYQGFAKGLFEKKPATTSKPDAIEGDIKKINEDISKINVEIDNLKKAGSGTGGQGTAGGNKPPSQVTTERIPVTPEIVNFLLEHGSEGLKFYLSKPFTLEMYEQNKTKEIEVINNMVIINPANPANEIPIEFPIDSEGILIGKSPGPDNSRELRIFFQKQGKTLIFIRNAQQNCYVLSNVEVIDNKNYKVNVPPEPILLEVSGRNNRKTEVQAVPTDFVYNNNAQPYQNINIGGYNDNYSYNVDYNRSVTPSRYVMGKGSLEPQRVIAYVKKMKNSPLSNSDIVIINEYFKEADYEGVNVDLAIAQMLYWTDYFKRRDRMAICNYGGLSDSSFQNWTIGVRAHIQHLKAYAHQRPKRELVDPRFSNAWERGFPGITFDKVYPIWSQNSRYGQKIENILRELYRFSGV